MAQEQTLEEFRRALVNARRAEVARLRERLPDPAEAVRRATGPSTHLWERRPNHDDFLQLSLGVATQTWTPFLESAPGSYGGTNEPPPEVAEALAQLGKLPLAPVGLDLAGGKSVGIVGQRAITVALLRSLVCQAAVHHGPADLRIAILTDKSREADWDWAKWLPHTASVDEASGRRMLASNHNDIEAVLSELSVAPPEQSGGSRDKPTGPVTLVVIDAEGLTEGRNSKARELLAGAGAPVAGIVVAASVDRLPAVCSRIAEIVGNEGVVRYTEPANHVVIPDVLVSGLTAEAARSCARALSGFEDPEVADRGADLPDRAALINLLEIEPTPDAVLGRWRQAGNVPKISGPIGVAETGPLSIDIVGDGPHGLIAGTTGAGKSELLRTIVASWAASVDPEHLNFVLVDYKGGSAFAQCEAAAPHRRHGHRPRRAPRPAGAAVSRGGAALPGARGCRDAGASDLKEYLEPGAPGAAPPPRRDHRRVRHAWWPSCPTSSIPWSAWPSGAAASACT